MKRSDMVVLISNWLLANAPETYQIQSSYGRRLDAEGLLEEIEKAGMLPPFNPQSVQHEGNYNTWEAE